VIGHKVSGRWKLENAKKINGKAKARVSSLSWFSAIKGCIGLLRKPGGAGLAISIAKCFARYGIRKLPEWISKKIIGFFNEYDACKPVSPTNWSVDILEGLLSACNLTDPPVPQPTPTQPPPATQLPPPPPTSYRYYVYHTCANGHCGLNVRTGPGYSAYAVVRILADGNPVDITCQTRGEPVSGADGSSSNVWDRLVDGNYAADFYVNTPGMTGSFSPPIPQC
jgi:hypothetical protein